MRMPSPSCPTPEPTHYESGIYADDEGDASNENGTFSVVEEMEGGKEKKKRGRPKKLPKTGIRAAKKTVSGAMGIGKK